MKIKGLYTVGDMIQSVEGLATFLDSVAGRMMLNRE